MFPFPKGAIYGEQVESPMSSRLAILLGLLQSGAKVEQQCFP